MQIENPMARSKFMRLTSHIPGSKREMNRPILFCEKIMFDTSVYAGNYDTSLLAKFIPIKLCITVNFYRLNVLL